MRALIIASSASSGQRCRRGGPAVIPTAPPGGTEPNLGPLHPPARRGRATEHIYKEIYLFFLEMGFLPYPSSVICTERALIAAGAGP